MTTVSSTSTLVEGSSKIGVQIWRKRAWPTKRSPSGGAVLSNTMSDAHQRRAASGSWELQAAPNADTTTNALLAASFSGLGFSTWPTSRFCRGRAPRVALHLSRSHQAAFGHSAAEDNGTLPAFEDNPVAPVRIPLIQFLERVPKFVKRVQVSRLGRSRVPV